MSELFLEYGLLGLFLASFLAATVVPFSSEAVMATMIGTDFSPVSVVLIATLGNWLGGITSYLLGRLGKWEWLEKWFRVDRKKVLRAMEKWQRFGVWLALLAWLPVVGDLIAVGLGFVRANWWKTIFLMGVGKLVRYTVLALSIWYAIDWMNS